PMLLSRHPRPSQSTLFPYTTLFRSEDGTDGAVKLRFEIRHIVEAHEFGAGNHGCKGQAIFFRGGDADGAEGAAVERILQREEAVLLRSRPGGFFRLACNKPSQLHRTVNGFRTAIREEDAIETGPSGEFAGERALARVVIEIRKMNRAGRFAADYFHDAGMRVTEGVDGYATEKVELPLPGGVKHISAAPERHAR